MSILNFGDDRIIVFGFFSLGPPPPLPAHPTHGPSGSRRVLMKSGAKEKEDTGEEEERDAERESGVGWTGA